MIPDLVNVLDPKGDAYVWLFMDTEGDDLCWPEAAEERTVGEMNPVLQDEIDCNGMDFIFDDLPFGTGYRTRNITWALKHGVAPGQPFLLRIGEPRIVNCGGYYEQEWDVEHDVEFIRRIEWPIDQVTEAWRSFWVESRRFKAIMKKRKRTLHTMKLRAVDKMKFNIEVYPGNNGGWGNSSYDYPPAGLIYQIVVQTFHTPFGIVMGPVAEVRDPDGNREKLKEALWEEIQKQGVPMDRAYFDALLKKRYA